MNPEHDEERVLPHDLVAEKCVIGAIMIDGTPIMENVCQFIKNPIAFYDDRHRTMFAVMLELFEANKPIDSQLILMTLNTKRLTGEVGGVEYIREICEAVPTTAHAEYYAAIVKEKHTRRLLISAANSALRDAYDSTDAADAVVDRSEARIFEVAQDRVKASVSNRIGDSLYDAAEAMFSRQEGSYTGLTSGLIALDDQLGGFQKGEMIVIGARPSVGKTAFACCILEHVALTLKKPCGLLSMEMSKIAICERFICSRAGVSSHKVRRGFIDHFDRECMAASVRQLGEAPIFIDDKPGLTPLDLRTIARRMVQKNGIELLCIDYLTLMQPSKKSENRQQEITQISAAIKSLVRELNIPIIVLSQLNRSNENEARLPRMSDLRESGSIEQDADVVLLLHREAASHRGDAQWMQDHHEIVNQAQVIIAKQRNGPTGLVEVTFEEATTRFVNRG